VGLQAVWTQWNLSGFLEQIAECHSEAMTDKKLKQLATHRQLPVDAFTAFDVGLFDGAYTIPVRNAGGSVVDVRRYGGKRMMSTPGCSSGLLGAHLMDKNRDATVYVVEGEWDAVALTWALRKAKRDDVVVAVPGAAAFKREWLVWFERRDVVLCYDHDHAGEEGELKAFRLLQSIARSVKCVHWPDELDKGFDVRDFVVARRKLPGGIVAALDKITQTYARQGGIHDDAMQRVANNGVDDIPDSIHPREGLAEYRKHVLLDDDLPLLAVFGAIMSTWVEKTDPVWLHLVAPPSGAKSAILQSLREAKGCYMIDTLTPKAMASGAMDANGADPSLLNQIDGQNLIIKDLTTLLTQHAWAKQEILGQLRSIYDGSMDRKTGIGATRHYTAHFGIIAGVTPAIDILARDAHLGERFLKFRMSNPNKKQRRGITMDVLRGIGKGSTRRNTLCRLVSGMLAWEGRGDPPDLNDDQRHRVMLLAEWTAAMRGRVVRHTYREEEVLARPSIEQPHRLALQLGKHAIGAAWFLGEDHVPEVCMQMAAQIACDTPPDREQDVVRAILQSEHGVLTLDDIERECGLPRTTAHGRLKDLQLLGVVQSEKQGKRYYWSVVPDVAALFPTT